RPTGRGSPRSAEAGAPSPPWPAERRALGARRRTACRRTRITKVQTNDAYELLLRHGYTEYRNGRKLHRREKSETYAAGGSPGGGSHSGFGGGPGARPAAGAGVATGGQRDGAGDIYGRPPCLVPPPPHTGSDLCRTRSNGDRTGGAENGGRQTAARSRGGALLRLLPVGPLPVHQAGDESAEGDGLYQGEGAVSGSGIQGGLAGSRVRG